MKSSTTTAVYQVKIENLRTTFKYLCTCTVKTYVDFYTKCYVLLVATGISRVLGCFKSRYYSCVQVKNDHVQALVPERPINVSDSITVDFSPTLFDPPLQGVWIKYLLQWGLCARQSIAVDNV